MEALIPFQMFNGFLARGLDLNPCYAGDISWKPWLTRDIYKNYFRSETFYCFRFSLNMVKTRTKLYIGGKKRLDNYLLRGWKQKRAINIANRFLSSFSFINELDERVCCSILFSFVYSWIHFHFLTYLHVQKYYGWIFQIFLDGGGVCAHVEKEMNSLEVLPIFLQKVL